MFFFKQLSHRRYKITVLNKINVTIITILGINKKNYH